MAPDTLPLRDGREGVFERSLVALLANETSWRSLPDAAQKKIYRYFGELATAYDTGPPFPNSFVRFDQDAFILSGMDGIGDPILVRGFWRSGKSSRVLTFANRFYSGKHVYINCQGYTGYSDENAKNIGLYEMAEFLALRDSFLAPCYNWTN